MQHFSSFFSICICEHTQPKGPCSPKPLRCTSICSRLLLCVCVCFTRKSTKSNISSAPNPSAHRTHPPTWIRDPIFRLGNNCSAIHADGEGASRFVLLATQRHSCLLASGMWDAPAPCQFEVGYSLALLGRTAILPAEATEAHLMPNLKEEVAQRATLN